MGYTDDKWQALALLDGEDKQAAVEAITAFLRKYNTAVPPTAQGVLVLGHHLRYVDVSGHLTEEQRQASQRFLQTAGQFSIKLA